jgi:PIN domain nuclease of toxin-antitoxin system
MRLLLDTHVLIWWLADEPMLSKRVRDLLREKRTEAFVSSASGWEIATKFRLGRLPHARALLRDMDDTLRREGMGVLPISLQHALAAGLIDSPHRDPFDRMLAAQSMIEGMPLVTNDRVLQMLAREHIW